MADESPAPAPSKARAPRKETPSSRSPAAKPGAPSTPAPAKASTAAPATPAPAKTPAAKPSPSPSPGAPKRPTLPAEMVTLLQTRRAIRRKRPIFGRQAANRYYRIGRDLAWRRPRGLQSKQRRHYGYRAEIVSIGYGSPARVRGLAPSGYRPVLVHNDAELGALDPKLQAAIIARTVGTRRRLGLEATARKRGVRVLNPIQTAGEE